MQERHTNRDRYFQEQIYTTEKYVIPYVNEVLPINADSVVCEVGCGEGGNLKPFVDLGCTTVGIDLSERKIEIGKELFADHPNSAKVTLIAEDIYNINPKEFPSFDLIILRDTIEHIHGQEKFMGFLKNFLKPNGKVFFAYPPWRMPFGGHQQICKSKFLSFLPYYHLLPNFIYIGMLKLFGESKDTIENLKEVKETGISIRRFRSILKKQGYKIDKDTLYMINPNYEVKFKLKVRKLPFIFNIPHFRDFFTTTYYSVVSVDENAHSDK